MLFSELYASIGAYEKGIVALQKDKSQVRNFSPHSLTPAYAVPGTTTIPTQNPSILFKGLQKYAVHPKRIISKFDSEIRNKRHQRRRCYNCKSPEHFIAQCPKPVSAEQGACRAFGKVHSEKDTKASFVNLAEQDGFLDKESDSDSDKDSSSPGSDSSQNEQTGTDEIKFVNFNLNAEVEGVPQHPYEFFQDSENYGAFLELSVVHGTDHFCTDLNPAVVHVMTNPDTPEIDISGP